MSPPKKAEDIYSRLSSHETTEALETKTYQLPLKEKVHHFLYTFMTHRTMLDWLQSPQILWISLLFQFVACFVWLGFFKSKEIQGNKEIKQPIIFNSSGRKPNNWIQLNRWTIENTQNKKPLDKLFATKEKKSRLSLPANINHGSLSSVVTKLWRWNRKALQVLWTSWYWSCYSMFY